MLEMSNVGIFFNTLNSFARSIAIVALRNATMLFQCLIYDRNHSIFRLDTHHNLTYLCAVTFNNNDYGKRKSKLSGGIRPLSVMQ